ncbi:hypothetical protein ABT317_18010, partial [Streptomyces carpinensis]
MHGPADRRPSSPVSSFPTGWCTARSSAGCLSSGHWAARGRNESATIRGTADSSGGSAYHQVGAGEKRLVDGLGEVRRAHEEGPWTPGPQRVEAAVLGVRR